MPAVTFWRQNTCGMRVCSSQAHKIYAHHRLKRNKVYDGQQSLITVALVYKSYLENLQIQ